jgi:hypothetical protein
MLPLPRARPHQLGESHAGSGPGRDLSSSRSGQLRNIDERRETLTLTQVHRAKVTIMLALARVLRSLNLVS